MPGWGLRPQVEGFKLSSLVQAQTQCCQPSHQCSGHRHITNGNNLCGGCSGGSEPRPPVCRTIKFWLLLFDPQNSDFFSGPSALLDKHCITCITTSGQPTPTQAGSSCEFSSLLLNSLVRVLEEDQLPGEAVGLVCSTGMKGQGTHGMLHGRRLGYMRCRLLPLV